ncbi:hypothetical protein, conserved [Eimeria tenella]|uniref:EamA domain-containing protein n=1 Tax=Eimeria tenella TaxID=5802 RepID=U6KU38_EIMTE|nr:hypothetical protein, conserved [Eimeria tenella]CDJ41456.1 hypothetical protein, conserved [Eimeria tenella]|eukprot:XP_013232206.1 hypothetical protein, conserved [Eimeria tenella]
MVLVCCLGILLIAKPGLMHETLGGGTIIAENSKSEIAMIDNITKGGAFIMLVVGAFLHGVSFVLGRHVATRGPPILSVLFMMFFGLVFFLPLVLSVSPFTASFFKSLEPAEWTALILLPCLGLGAQLCLISALEFESAATIAIVQNLDAVFSYSFQLIIGEGFNVASLCGAGLIVFSAIVLAVFTIKSWMQREKQAAAAAAAAAAALAAAEAGELQDVLSTPPQVGAAAGAAAASAAEDGAVAEAAAAEAAAAAAATEAAATAETSSSIFALKVAVAMQQQLVQAEQRVQGASLVSPSSSSSSSSGSSSKQKVDSSAKLYPPAVTNETVNTAASDSELSGLEKLRTFGDIVLLLLLLHSSSSSCSSGAVTAPLAVTAAGTAYRTAQQQQQQLLLHDLLL